MNSNFRNVNFMKHQWTKNITKQGGAQNEVIKNKSCNDLVILSVTKKYGRMWCSMSENDLINNIENNNGLYEVITSYPHKVYFDIDMDKKTDRRSKRKKSLYLSNDPLETLFV